MGLGKPYLKIFIKSLQLIGLTELHCRMGSLQGGEIFALFTSGKGANRRFLRRGSSQGVPSIGGSGQSSKVQNARNSSLSG